MSIFAIMETVFMANGWLVFIVFVLGVSAGMVLSILFGLSIAKKDLKRVRKQLQSKDEADSLES